MSSCNCAIIQPAKRLPANLVQLRNDINNGAVFDYELFWSGSPFSQWHHKGFTLDGVAYPTAENYMMAEKARLFGDRATLDKILAARQPKDVKQLGRQVRGFDAAIWDANKLAIVLTGNMAKVNQNIGIKECLLATYDRILVEASPYDAVWGIGLDCSHKYACNPIKWRGQNLLGFILTTIKMQIRKKESL